MKKLLTMLTATSFVVSTLTTTVSCMPKQLTNSKTSPLKIGLDIDKTKAIDSSVDPNTHHGFTNYFVVGDSLSDVDGLTTYLKDKFFVSTGLDSKINFDLELSGSYGFVDENIHHNAFSNGPTAGYNLAKALNFDDLKPSNKYSKLDDAKYYGKNYAIGGATAATTSDIKGKMVFNDVSTEVQSRVLLNQHKISSNDLVFFEIGGNDLFAMIADQKNGNDKQVIEYMNESIKRIRNTLFTLLNNGIKNIIFMGPPIMDDIPRYARDNDLEKEEIIDLGKEFELKFNEIIKEVKTYYPKNLFYTSLYEGENSFPVLQKKYEEILLAEGIIANEDQYKSNKSFTETVNIKVNQNKINLANISQASINDFLLTYKNNQLDGIKDLKVEIILKGNEENSWNNLVERDKKMDPYFFTDIVHPTKRVHEYVGKMLFDMATKEFK